jgi:colanic acid biosynthesis protein WcaH
MPVTSTARYQVIEKTEFSGDLRYLTWYGYRRAMSSNGHIPQKEWEIIVENVPIVSVDLVVQDGNSVVLGKRTNEPAKGEWWVPGGRVRKHEQLMEAVHRIAEKELGISVTIERQLGVYQHFYDIADVPNADGKHYVPVCYLVVPDHTNISPDDQHSEFKWFSQPFEGMNLNPYVDTYLDDAGIHTE